MPEKASFHVIVAQGETWPLLVVSSNPYVFQISWKAYLRYLSIVAALALALIELILGGSGKAKADDIGKTPGFPYSIFDKPWEQL